MFDSLCESLFSNTYNLKIILSLSLNQTKHKSKDKKIKIKIKIKINLKPQTSNIFNELLESDFFICFLAVHWTLLSVERLPSFRFCTTLKCPILAYFCHCLVLATLFLLSQSVYLVVRYLLHCEALTF